MNTWLIELSFGPVQGFIAAARSSRDLWTGSRLLSGIARIAGKSLLGAGAELVYPVESRVRNENPDENSNLSNVLLARVDAGDAAEAGRIAKAAQQAAREWLKTQAGFALKEWTGAGVKIRDDLWHRQVDDALESYAAWSRIAGDDYRAAYDRTKAALGARKNTRNFEPMFPPGQEDLGFGIPKSSLDGVRESVLPEKRKSFPRKFHVSPGEQLDALGCIKRVAEQSERFTALTRLAADGWISQLDEAERGALGAAYDPVVKSGHATRTEGNAGSYAAFPFDAGLLYPERLEAALKEARDERDADGQRALQGLRDALGPLWRKHGRPCPYTALVMADGDRMGAFIDKAKTPEQHNAISDAIADFSDKVPEIVREHRGHCIYNGGEDVMALFPLAGVVPGARALSAAFDNHMRDVVKQVLGESPNPDGKPSLRVGAAICHVQEPLGVIRQRGDAAEKFAKGEAGTGKQGNALGLQLYVRAGHVVPWRARFDDPAQFEALDAWCDAFADNRIAGKLPYRIRQAWLAGVQTGLSDEVIHCEVRRALLQANKSGGGEAIEKELIESLLQRAASLRSNRDPTGYETLVAELILARWLTARSATDLGREGA